MLLPPTRRIRHVVKVIVVEKQAKKKKLKSTTPKLNFLDIMAMKHALKSG